MKKREVAMAVADWSSMREMRKASSSSGVTPSPVVVHPFGILPTFSRPPNPPVAAVVPPPLTTLPTFSAPAQPIHQSNSSSISRPMGEKKKNGDGMSFMRPPSSRNPREQKEELRSKNSMDIGFTEDEMISMLDEDANITRYCKKIMREEGITEEKVKKMLNKLEEEGSARRADFKAMWTLDYFVQRHANHADEHLRIKDSKSANICEMLLQERSPFVENVERQLKNNNVGLALEMMKLGGLEPVKISEWADRADYDDYYIGRYARGVCKELTDGIIKIKPGNTMNSSTFIMGDALIEYSILFKDIYSNELLANIEAAPGKRINVENIAATLGLSGLESFQSHIPINHSSAFVIVQESDGRFVKMRA